MKKIWLSLLFACSCNAYAVNGNTTILDVFKEAMLNDPTYGQNLAQRLVDRQYVPINIATLLPQAMATFAPQIKRTLTSGSATQLYQGSSTGRGYNFNLSVTQAVFDFSKFAQVATAVDVAKQADAVLNAQTQQLILDVAKAYFKILNDQDNLRYSKGSKTAFASQLNQAKQQYAVGLKTITDVYTAAASYQASVATYITAENALANDKENLRAMTGNIYPALANLRENFPLISPAPNDIDQWVTTAGKQNWSIRAAQYALQAASARIKAQEGGHLPTLSATAMYDGNFSRATGGSSPLQPRGATTTHTTSVGLNLALPIFSGGSVVALTQQAQYNYQVASAMLEKSLRESLKLTRQSFLNIVADISKIKADRESIKSNISSLEGMQTGYKVGTEILVNVLNQQEKVYQAQELYAFDRYDYVISLLALKQAAGTLGLQDLIALNSWLVSNEPIDKKLPLHS